MTTQLTHEAVRAAGTCAILERRTLGQDLADAHLRDAAADAATRTFVGHAAVFNSRTEIGDPLTWGWYEEIASTAFDKTLQEGDVNFLDPRFLVDHETAMLVARVSAGDLRLATDTVGLAVESDLDQELSYVRDLTRNLDKRRITGMSFGFYVDADAWSEETVEVIVDGETRTITVYVRTIKEVRLLEVSAVTFPAYEDTDASVRASEIRAARGVPNVFPSASEGNARPAPASAARGSERLDERATALAIRYRLPR